MPVGVKLLLKTLPLLTGTSTTASANLSTCFTQIFLEQRTIDFGSNGSIVAVNMFHGISWFKNAPDVGQLLSAQQDSDVMAAAEVITSYVDGLISTMNPGIAGDGGADAIPPPAKTKPQHVCNKSYVDIQDSTWISSTWWQLASDTPGVPQHIA